MHFIEQKFLHSLLKFHQNLFLVVQLTICHRWFRQWLGGEQATSHCRLNSMTPHGMTRPQFVDTLHVSIDVFYAGYQEIIKQPVNSPACVAATRLARTRLTQQWNMVATVLIIAPGKIYDTRWPSNVRAPRSCIKTLMVAIPAGAEVLASAKQLQTTTRSCLCLDPTVFWLAEPRHASVNSRGSQAAVQRPQSSHCDPPGVTLHPHKENLEHCNMRYISITDA